MIEQENRNCYQAWFYNWLVMIGYGGKLSNESNPLKTISGFDVSDFKHNYFDYDFTVEFTDADPEGWIMHVFNKITKEEIGIL